MNKFTDVIVVVHGIGDQLRNATVRSVANRLATSDTLCAGGTVSPVAPQPLGYFQGDVKRLTESRLVDDHGRLKNMSLAAIGVAEAFWADIPQDVVDEGRTMEETKAWAGTVVARAKALYQDAMAANTETTALVKPDFGLAAEVLDEMIDTIRIMENFCGIAEKAGLFTFDLAAVLEKYLGDVQVVAEFSYHRTNIVGRFHQAMTDILNSVVKDNPDIRLHIVAHSEGTVVSYLGLLYAMSGQKVTPAIGDEDAAIGPVGTPPAWLAHVAGYMTIGSPIDKHLLLWPRIWEKLAPARANALFQSRPIKWRNYYDYGDPVGFKLETAREWMGRRKLTAFEFEEKHDYGFARYLMPGAAHNAYWDDPAVFEHFIADVVKQPASTPKAPSTRPLVATLSPCIPYVLSFLILMTGTYLLYKQVGLYSHPEPVPLEAAEIVQRIGVTRSSTVDGFELLRNVFALSALLAGTTLIARLPRLMAHRSWIAFAALGFGAGCLAYVKIVSPDSRNEIGSIFSFLPGENAPTFGVLVLALLVGLIGLGAATGHGKDRRQRWLFRGMRPLIACGAIGVILIIAGRMFFPALLGTVNQKPDEKAFIAQYLDNTVAPLPETQRLAARRRLEEKLDTDFANARFTREELDQFFGRNDDEAINETDSRKHLARLKTTIPLLGDRPPVWPIMLMAAAFLYLWWLATLLFDLAFVWHRYIRQSTTNRWLQQWDRLKRSPDNEGSAPSPQ